MNFETPFQLAFYLWSCGLILHTVIWALVMAVNALNLFNFWSGKNGI